MRCTNILNWISLLMLLLVMASCKQETEQEAGQTYPDALDLEQIDFASFADTSLQQGSYNMEAQVVEIIECPPNAGCTLTDGVSVAEDLNVGYVEHNLYKGYFISVKNPQQLHVQKKYLLSVKVDQRSRFEMESNFPGRTRELLGYTEASQY